MSDKYIIGADIGGTNIRVGVVDNNFNVVESKIIKTNELVKDNDVCGALIKIFKEIISSYDNKIEAISMGLPSILNKDRTKIISTPNISQLDNVEIVKRFEESFGLHTFIEKDACVLLYNDLFKNNLPLDGISIGIYYGTGIGNAILWDGKLLSGKHGAACELGHIPVLGTNYKCVCGLYGCIETFAGGKVIEKICQEHYPNTLISDLFVKHSNEKEVEKIIDAMSIPAASEINIFDPDHIILGGGILSMKDFPKDKLEERIRYHTRKPIPEKDIKLYYANPSHDNGIIGSAIYATTKLKQIK